MTDSRPDAADPLLGQVFEGKYEILSVLGQGGMGRVYKARHIEMEKIVAIKTLVQGAVFDDNTYLRFKQEAIAASSLNHPNIIAIYDFGRSVQGFAYLVMEFLRGKSLQDLSGNIGPARFQRIFSQVCDGMQHAHKKGIIHRDLKPSNLMLLDNEEGAEIVKIVDFGLAKLNRQEGEQQRLTATGVVMGSPFYMSPEQCRGEELDPRSDIYSLGCVMYATLSGTVPLMGSNAMATIYKHIADLPAPISELVPQLKSYPQLEALIMKTLEKDPEQRPQSMAALSRELALAVGGGAPSLAPAGTVAPASSSAVNPDRTRPMNSRSPVAGEQEGSRPSSNPDPGITSQSSTRWASKTDGVGISKPAGPPLQTGLPPAAPGSGVEHDPEAVAKGSEGGFAGHGSPLKSPAEYLRSSRTGDEPRPAFSAGKAQATLPEASVKSPARTRVVVAVLGVLVVAGGALALLKPASHEPASRQASGSAPRQTLPAGLQQAQPAATQKQTDGQAALPKQQTTSSEISSGAKKQKSTNLHAVGAVTRPAELAKKTTVKQASRPEHAKAREIEAKNPEVDRLKAQNRALELNMKALAAFDSKDLGGARDLFKKSLAQEKTVYGAEAPALLPTIAWIMASSKNMPGHAANKEYPASKLDLALKICLRSRQKAVQVVERTESPASTWRCLAFSCFEVSKVRQAAEQSSYLRWTESFYQLARDAWTGPRNEDYVIMLRNFLAAARQSGDNEKVAELKQEIAQVTKQEVLARVKEHANNRRRHR